MAKIELGLLIIGIRGRIAGTIFSANAAGPYAKAFAKSPNARSDPQQIPRAALSRISIRWNRLAIALRAQWDTYAALPAQQKTDSLGQTYNPSGFNYYVAFNLHRVTAGHAVFDGPPTATVPAVVAATGIVVNIDPANTAVITYTAAPNATEDAIIFAQLRMTSTNLAVPVRTYLHVHTEAQGAGVNPITVSNLDDFFGPIQADQKLFTITYGQHAQGRRNAGSEIGGIAA